jgi:hypothetical protein
MITIKDWMELVDYRITEGGDYLWQCYGTNTHTLTAWNGRHDDGGWSSNIVFDTDTQEVYEVEVCDYTNQRAYRLVNPEYDQDRQAEADQRGIDDDQAWDDVEFLDLAVAEDFMEKANAIIMGLPYDTRVQIALELTDDEMLTYMLLAHEKDITFNQLVVQAIQAFMDQHVKFKTAKA